MCDNFYDIRTFGAVLSTGINAGQVRGPVQIAFARSVEPVLPLEISITRMAATNEAEKKQRVDGRRDEEKRGDNRTMGRKHIVPYGLYRAHGFVSAPLAHDAAQGHRLHRERPGAAVRGAGDMFEHDRSAARGEMATRKLDRVPPRIRARQRAGRTTLFDRVTTWRGQQGSGTAIGDSATDNWPPARSFADYAITVDRAGLPGRRRDDRAVGDADARRPSTPPPRTR